MMPVAKFNGLAQALERAWYRLPLAPDEKPDARWWPIAIVDHDRVKRPQIADSSTLADPPVHRDWGIIFAVSVLEPVPIAARSALPLH